MATFVDMIYYLQAIGVADVLLPFFLVFTVVFAVLQKSHVLGKGEGVKKYNVIVSLALGLAVVIPHVLGTYPPGMNVVLILNNALPQVSIFLVAIVMLLLMLGTFGLSWPGSNEGEGGSVVVIASILIITYIFTTSSGLIGNGFPWWLWFLADPQTQSMLVTILVFGVVVWLITREPKEKDPNDKFVFTPRMINSDGKVEGGK